MLISNGFNVRLWKKSHYECLEGGGYEKLKNMGLVMIKTSLLLLADAAAACKIAYFPLPDDDSVQNVKMYEF